MISKIVLGTLVVVVVSIASQEIGLRPAFACNRTAGCAMDVIEEGRDMMQSGKMIGAMREGQENIAAFKRLQESERAWAQGGNSARRKK